MGGIRKHIGAIIVVGVAICIAIVAFRLWLPSSESSSTPKSEQNHKLSTGGQILEILVARVDSVPYSNEQELKQALREEKLDPKFDATNLRQGVADLETSLPMLYSTGVLGGRISLEQFVAVTSTNPAKLFGLYPQKGTINVGCDADMVVWDNEETRIIDGASMHSRSDYSPYDGFKVTGWPKYTISRGEVVLDGSKIVGTPGRGRLVRRGRHRSI